ncbi:MAG: hypothetical protein ABI822_20305 [Bryobacteraceae bacterium]
MMTINTRCAALFLSLVVFAVAGTPSQGIEGKWVLDKKKSGDIPQAPQDLVQQIKMDGNSMIIKSKFAQPKNGIYPILWVGLMSEELRLNTDGTEAAKSIGPFEFRAKTDQNGSAWVTNFTANMENGMAPGQEAGSVEGQWLRTISEDGRGMTLQIKTKCSDGRSLDKTLYFNRK